MSLRKPVVSILLIAACLAIADSNDPAREKFPHLRLQKKDEHIILPQKIDDKKTTAFFKFARDYNIYHSLSRDHGHHHYTRKSKKKKEKKKKSKKNKKNKYHSHNNHHDHSYDHNHDHDHHSHDNYYYDHEDYYYDHEKYYYDHTHPSTYDHSHTHSHDKPSTNAPNAPGQPTPTPGTPTTKSPTRSNPTPTDPTPSTSPPTSTQSCPFSVFINEFHYNDNNDAKTQFVEVAHSLDIDIRRYRLYFYNGTTGKVYNEINGLGSNLNEEDEINGMKVSQFPLYDSIFEIEEKVHGGFALLPPDGDNTVLDFVSYGGQFKATDGPVNGLASSDVSVTETNTTSPNRSIQRGGFGYEKKDFRSWGGPNPSSPGRQNNDQGFSCDLKQSNEVQALSAAGNVMAESNALTEQQAPGRVSPEEMMCRMLVNAFKDAIPLDVNICGILGSLYGF